MVISICISLTFSIDFNAPQVFKVIPAVVDGEFFPRHPEELLASADFHPVPSIIGVNNDEYGWLFSMVRLSSNLLDAWGLIWWAVGTQRFVDPYPCHDILKTVLHTPDGLCSENEGNNQTNPACCSEEHNTTDGETLGPLPPLQGPLSNFPKEHLQK